MATATRLRATVRVRCIQCGDIGEITDRQHRRKLQEGSTYRCRLCRETKVKPPTQAHYNYWLNRYSLDEIQEMARAIWG